jgi:hypothetical protein
MTIDSRAAEQGLIGKPMKPIIDGGSLTSGNECDIIDNVREVPIGSLAPGRRFDLVLTATTPPPHKRLRGTLVRKGPGTVAVVLDDAEKQRSFTTAEGSVVVLRQAGGIIYWSPGTPVLALVDKLTGLAEMRDVSRWTTRGGTGVGPDMHHPDNYTTAPDKNSLAESDEGDDMSERTAALPGIPGAVRSSKKAKVKGSKAKAKAKAPKELHPCLCGCGERVAGRFRQGHDGRYYSLLKKVSAGEMQFNELPKGMQSSLGSVAGAKKALKDSKH